MSKKQEYKMKNEQFLIEKTKEEGVKQLRGGVLYEVLERGESDKSPGPRSIVTCHYKGMTINGHVFDETFQRGCPAAFRVNELISGFQIALVNMHIGDHWRVYIPSEMGYGARGAGGDIPGNATLIFEIQLMAIG
ncbi:MAG: FKBP-type peptidyl-prolyl cis-trans isomerase [Bacteroidales bacterium]|nr:FKBP-type peptidyl-prolyl cis-trans isomerase [Candidatus Physcousia equi]